MIPQGPSYEKKESLQDPFNRQHKFLITGAKGSNGTKLNVRCKCMAEYKNVSDRYYTFDKLAVVDSLEQARRVYADHLIASKLRTVVELFHLGLIGVRRDRSSIRDSHDRRRDQKGRSRRAS